MKYSIRGNLSLADGTSVNDVLNQYTLWRLITNQTTDELGNDLFTFEAWVNTLTDKDNLFNELKPFVDQYGEVIDWHECTHDESTQAPCVISEEYRR
ncbi:hypothetical protein ABFJ98_3777 [Acinetobacter baumannii]